MHGKAANLDGSPARLVLGATSKLAELRPAGRDRQGDCHHHHVQVRGTHQHRRSPDRVLRRRVQGDDPAMAGRQEKSLAG